MIPGELLPLDGPDIELNAGRETVNLRVANIGDRPIQVGSHYHFFETNDSLQFDRVAARGFRLNIPAGTAVRFEPGQERDIELVAYAGDRIVHGFQGKVEGPLELPSPAGRGAGGEGLAGRDSSRIESPSPNPLPGGEGFSGSAS